MKRSFFILVASLAATTLTAFSPALAEGKQPPIVLVEDVKPQDIQETLLYPGRVEVTNMAPIVSEWEGVVTRIVAPLGKRVKRGEALYVVENADPAYSYAPVSVPSPIAGVVVAHEVTPGARVSRGTKMGTVSDPSTHKVVIELAAGDIPRITAGMKAELSAPALTDKIPLKVAGISPVIDPLTQTGTCELTSAGTKTPLIPGLLGQVRVIIGTRSGILLPEDAVVQKAAETIVRVVEADKAKYVPVTLGPKKNGKVEIIQGLKPGMRVITRANGYIADGDAVTVKVPEVASK